RVLVHHQVHLGREVLDQPVQEADEHPGGEGPLEHGDVQLAARTDRAHGVDTEPVTGPGGGRCVPLQPPGATRQVIRTHPRRAAKPSRRSFQATLNPYHPRWWRRGYNSLESVKG